MPKWETGSLRTLKEAYPTTQFVIPKSLRWVLSCENGWLYTKVGQENVGFSTARLVEVCSPKGETPTMILDVTHAQK